jgi:SAM-dependent methyltransferase
VDAILFKARKSISATAAQSLEAKVGWYRNEYYGGSARSPDSMKSGWTTAVSQIEAYATLRRTLLSGTVLDLGCGDGALLAYLSTTGPSEIVPFGVDFLEESVSIAQSRFPQVPRGHFVVSDVESFSKKRERTFRAVVTSPSYARRGCEVAYVRDCLGLVAAGGKLVLYTYRGSDAFRSFCIRWRYASVFAGGSFRYLYGRNVTALVHSKE